LGAVAEGDYAFAERLWTRHGPAISDPGGPGLLLRLLSAEAARSR